MSATKLALPRGRVPTDATKLKAYIAKVALENGVSLDEAEKFVVNRSKSANDAISLNPEQHAVLPEKVSEESDEETLQRLSGRFDMMHTIARGACVGNVRSVIISGVGGVGKTYDIEQMLDMYRETQNLQSEVVRGVLTPVNLYKLLYRNRTKHCVTVLDDADQIFWNEDAVSILKAALDSSLVRKISWMSESNALKQDDVPPNFIYEGSMIFLTNIDFQDYVDKGKGKLAPHLQALLTRAMYLDLKLNDLRSLSLWIEHVVSKNHILVKGGLSLPQENEVLDFIKKNRGRLRNLSIRTALKIAQMVAMDPKGWQKMAYEVECR
jgi:hypothetical protein